jgi:uncharacterized protein YciI
MLYAIIGRDMPNCLAKRLAVRPAHLERLQALQAEGRLLLAGPLPAGFIGSLVVAEFPSLEEAKFWAEADPYMTNGVYAAIEVLPFKKVLPP